MNSEELKELLHYDPETGVFTRKTTVTNNAKAGDIVGCPTKEGYLRVVVNRKWYLVHRLIWLYVYGRWPDKNIDHINGVKNDNRLCNLREATKGENSQNKKVYLNNKSGYIGVCWHKATRKWLAAIQIDYVKTHLGLFDTPEEAYAAYLKAKETLHEFQPVPREVVTK